MLPTDLTNGLVGIKSRGDEVKRILRLDSSEVLFIGICGMSGIGKTTLAEAVYKEIRYKFDRSSFIENIKDISKQNDSTDLSKLQQKLLHDLLKDESIRVQNVSDGQTLLGTKLRGLKVMIVLDDVNHADQLTYLAGVCEWFGPGSRIIVTTTNTGLLNSHYINEIHRCEEMEGDEAISLFCHAAFKQGHPAHGYEELSYDIVKLACGLPLALNVYGSLLCGKEKSHWTGMIKKLQEYPNEEVVGRLEVVYARLERFQQKTFIYIACFLKGRSKDLVEDILNNTGLYPECGVADLKNNFLITIKPDDTVWVHDLLQQMCWEVLRKERDKIAIKNLKDAEDILLDRPKKMRKIEIINEEPYNAGGADLYVEHDCLSELTELKFLRIGKSGINQSRLCLSSDLRILEWYGCSLKSLPSTFKPVHIFEIEMSHSLLETLWEKDLDLPNLRSINLSFSRNLTKLPDMTSALNLEKLYLEGCTNLVELHESVLTRKKLRYMNLKGCTRLHSLGSSTMEMDALEALHLSGCSKLEYIPRFGQNMRSLQHLYVDGTSIIKLPDNLGEMCDLRNIDVSGTSIEELPSSIHQLKRLRILHAHTCHLSFKTGFLCTNLDTLPSGLRHLDLRHCNLSVVPDGIGLLYSLITLNLSGNDFVSLPASIGLLSKLRILCLDDCKKLQLLPKLSAADDDMDYEPRSRFSYYVSVEGIDVSKLHATDDNTSPTVSCLNCPKLVKNEHGSCLTEQILNSYLQLRSDFWITPEAVFEIVGAGSQIPSRFKMLSSDERMILKGPFNGVAMCAVIAVDHISAYTEALYVVTVHIHAGDTRWKVSLPVNCLVEGLENQLLLYWTGHNSFQRILASETKEFHFSFNVEPGDGSLQLTKFGVHFIRDEDILQLKQHGDPTIKVVNNLFHATFRFPIDLQCYIRACEADTHLHTYHLDIHEAVSSILDYGNQRDSLNDIHEIMKYLTELNQQVFNECGENWKHTFVFPLVYDYYRICHGISELYNDFLRLLKDASGSWLCVKYALEKNMEKIRVGDYTYKEMLQRVNDTEAPKSVRPSDNFLILFAYICHQTVAFIGHVNKAVDKFELLKVMAKVLSITVAVILPMVAKYMGDTELLQEVKDITSYTLLLPLIQNFSGKTSNTFIMKPSYERDLCISDFQSSACLLQELKNKMARLDCVTNENEEQVTIVIDQLGKNINNILVIVDNMCSYAQQFTLHMTEAGRSLNSLFPDGNLQVSEFRVDVTRDEDSVMKALYQATRALFGNLPWYVCACRADAGLHLCHSIIQDATSTQIKYFTKCGKQRYSLDSIRRIFQCLYEVNQKALTTNIWWGDLRSIILQTSRFYMKLTRLMKDISDSWLSVKLALEQFVRKSRVDVYTSGQMLKKFNVYSPDFLDRSVTYAFKETILSLGTMNKYGNMVKEETEASMVFIAGMLGVLGIYMGDSDLLEELSDTTPNSEHLLTLITKYSMEGGIWFDTDGNLIKRNHNGEELQIWDYYGDAVVGELKMKMAASDNCFTQEIKEDMVVLIDELQMNINCFAKPIQDMYTEARDFHESFLEMEGLEVEE